ncbi:MULTISPECIES: DUF1109 domain-containing protein [unclassified Yoonia]|uniref:DUF1109 domain-containing protein n=1 Tax=unclassified Yoonia TaxID=2629118 RepID=UPI002AFFC2BF|nr:MULTISPECIES: DUF1109 domain-containing protein [unclassified Yoonia]
MKTDDLIAALAADTLPQPTVAHRLARSFPVALAICVAAFIAFWGTRPDLSAALASASVLKTVLPALLAVLAGAGVMALAHPGMRTDRRLGVIGLFIGALAVVLVVYLARGGVAGVVMALTKPSLLICLVSIPLLGLPLLVAILWSLSTGAVLRPRLTGAIAGLMAGGVSAAVYSAYCDTDMVLYVILAYGAAILSVAAIGALAGPRLLRW